MKNELGFWITCIVLSFWVGMLMEGSTVPGEVMLGAAAICTDKNGGLKKVSTGAIRGFVFTCENGVEISTSNYSAPE